MAMDLPNAELRWMYTIFLQALGRYLGIKAEMGQVDDAYAYAAEVLCHYARWMAENEYPYLEKPDILEFPTETWAAQEFRKVHILLSACSFVRPDRGSALAVKAVEIHDKALEKLLSFKTCGLTRPLALLMLNQQAFNMIGQPEEARSKHDFSDAQQARGRMTAAMRVRRLMNRWAVFSIAHEYRFFYWKVLKKIIG